MFVLTELKNMQIRRAIFYFDLCLWFVFLAECATVNMVDVVDDYSELPSCQLS